MSMRIQTFETILIFSEKLTEEEYINKSKEYKKWIEGLPSAKIKSDRLGKKKLAYKARGCNYGWYTLFTYESTGDLINTKLDLMLRKDDDVIKFITTNIQEDYIPGNYINGEPEDQVNRKKIVDVFDLIFGLEEVI